MKPLRAYKGRSLKDLALLGPMIWAIVLGSILILAALIFAVQQIASHERELAYANAADINSKIALSDEVRIRSLLASLDKVLLVLRKDFAQNPKLTQQELLLRLDDLKIDNELNPRISIVDASGKVLLSSARTGDGRKPTFSLADRRYFKQQISEQSDLLDVGSPIESRFTGQWVVPLTRRISGTDGKFGGIVVMTVDPSLFSEPFAKTLLGANATRALIGLDGFTRLRLTNGRIEFGGDARKSQLFNEIKRSRAGTYTAIATSDGIQRMVSYRAVDPYGIVILAGSSIDSIEASYFDNVRGYLIGASLLGFMIVLLSGLLILGVVRQKKLFESQQSFNRLIELIPQLVTNLDVQGNIIWVNSRTVEYVGPSAEEQARGFDWVFAAIHPEDQGRVKAFVSSALLRHQNAESCEYRKRRFDGAYLWFSSQITPVLDKDDGSTAFLQTGTDIHDRKMGEERARVTQKLESIGQLTGGMAHDFNNLLAIILGNLDLLKPSVEVGAPSKRLDVAISAAQRGVGLVKSLLAMASKQPLLPATIDLGALAERISPLLKHAVGQRVNFVVQSPGGVVLVEVDEAGLESVLLNLIVNARDAMPKGGDLSLSLGVTDGMARIAITDTGTGMPAAVLKRATEPFFTTKERGHGTGLGLSMVAGFVKQSGGTMKIQSTEGKGTTIEMFLPLVHDSKATNIALSPIAPVAAPSPAPAPLAATSSKRKILIVDDEPELAELVRAWAKDQGHTAVMANSADDALTLLAVRAFDVMFTDIMMPGQMDGIGLAEVASAMYPAMKINLMSGYSKETATNRADVPWPLLVKPFGKEDFYEALKRAFGDSEFAALV
jgi:PAS domain S-box-containing protein